MVPLLRLFNLVCCVFSHSESHSLPPLWNIAHQAPVSVEFSRQEYRRGLPFPSPGDLPYPGIEPASLASRALAGGFFTTSATWEAPQPCSMYQNFFTFYHCRVFHCIDILHFVFFHLPVGRHLDFFQCSAVL